MSLLNLVWSIDMKDKLRENEWNLEALRKLNLNKRQYYIRNFCQKYYYYFIENKTWNELNIRKFFLYDMVARAKYACTLLKFSKEALKSKSTSWN